MGVREAEPYSDDELSLAELVVDPMIQALMHADGVKTMDIVLLFLKAKARLGRPSANVPDEDEIVARSGYVGRRRVGMSQRWSTEPLNPTRLREAVAAVKRAKQKLREAEQRFDRDCGRDASTLIQQVRTAERNVRTALADLARLDRGSPR